MEYSKLKKTFDKKQGLKMAKFVFTNLMLPMQVDRKVVDQYVKILLDTVAVTNNEAYWD